MIKKFMAGMMAAVTMLTGLTSITAEATYCEETNYYDVYEEIMTLRDENKLKAKAEDMKKLASIYTYDDTNELIHAAKLTYCYGTTFSQRAFVMVGYKVNGYFLYRSYTMATDDTMEVITITDVSMKWNCVELEKIDGIYEVSYA